MLTTAAMNVEIKDKEIIFTREFDAPRARVFKAWIEPEQLEQWWGPHGFTNFDCKTDLRPGGVWRIVMRSPEGGEYPCVGEYREIVEPERLILTDSFRELPAEWLEHFNKFRKGGEVDLPADMLMSMTFDEHDGKTRLTVQSFCESNSDRDAILEMGASGGWAQSFERLDEFLAKNRAAGPGSPRVAILPECFSSPRR